MIIAVMKILAIETSCDETAISVVDANGDFDNFSCTVLGNTLLSQAAKHAEFGGVYPNLAKREHAKNLIPIFEKTLKEAKLYTCTGPTPDKPKQDQEVEKILEREPELLEQFLRLFTVLEKPNIDAIAVTHGPGLEPALWVGINFASALSRVWNIPIVPVNHMEGHLFSSLLKTNGKEFSISNVGLPLLALLISGGHTELVLMKEPFMYELIGTTKDDAVGEAYDKVARMLDLPYPGGPEISKLSEEAREKNIESTVTLPRPMLHSDNCDFSFSGLKTAVLYALRRVEITNKMRQEFAREFEDAVVEILLKKTLRAVQEHSVKTLILGGGVSANTLIRKEFQHVMQKEYRETELFLPPKELTTDNAIMIAIAGYFRLLQGSNVNPTNIRAKGNLALV
jgi:N6-L-threonylcarbamoyladenine synthase